MQVQGTISQWQPNQGVGLFITDNGEELPIKANHLEDQQRTPQAGDRIVCSLEVNNQNELIANHVIIEDDPENNTKQKAKPESIKLMDHALIALIIISFAYTVYMFFNATNPEQAVIYGIPGMIAYMLLIRKEKPEK